MILARFCVGWKGPTPMSVVTRQNSSGSLGYGISSPTITATIDRWQFQRLCRSREYKLSVGSFFHRRFSFLSQPSRLSNAVLQTPWAAA